MEEELRLAVARWRLGLLAGEALPEIAARALEAGASSPALSELSTMHGPTLRDAEDLFIEELGDLGIPRPGTYEAGIMLTRHYSGLIVAGELSPYEGARRIAEEVYRRIGRPRRLAGFASGASLIETCELMQPGKPGASERMIAESEAEIRTLAADLLRSGDASHDRTVEPEGPR